MTTTAERRNRAFHAHEFLRISPSKPIRGTLSANATSTEVGVKVLVDLLAPSLAVHSQPSQSLSEALRFPKFSGSHVSKQQREQLLRRLRIENLRRKREEFRKKLEAATRKPETSIIMNQLVAAMISDFGTDPEGWDKPMSKAELAAFIKSSRVKK